MSNFSLRAAMKQNPFGHAQLEQQQSGKISVMRDLFGFRDQHGNALPGPPAVTDPPQAGLSMRRQLQYVFELPRFDIAVFEVGADNFSEEDRRQVCAAIQMARFIFDQVDLGIGFVFWGGLPASEAGWHQKLDGRFDLYWLEDFFPVSEQYLNVYVCRDGDKGGISPIPGPCGTSSVKSQALVITLRGKTAKTDLYRGNTLAHECGHFLGGLNHEVSDTNFIGGTADDPADSDIHTGIRQDQADAMKKHCKVKNT